MSLSSLLFIVFDLMGMFLENSSKYFKSKARSTFGETESLEFPSRLHPVPECVSCDVKRRSESVLMEEREYIFLNHAES